MILLVIVLGAAAAIAPPIVTCTLDELIKAASDTCAVLPIEMLYKLPAVPDLDIMEFKRDSKVSFKLNKAHKSLRNRLPNNIVIYIPGWWNTPSDESTRTIVSALLTKNPSVLVVNTRPTFGLGYVSSASRVNGVAQNLFKFIYNLHRHGYSLSSIHLIGFSLGAHVAGITGKLVQKRLKGKIKRITALDPARPCFLQFSQYRLDKEDAKFVNVIHSSIGVLGIEEPLGHVDVFLNGVTVPQPECKGVALSLECDHALAWRTFSSSVVEEDVLLGRLCRSFEELRNGRCRGNKTFVGYDCNTSNRGIFLYKTSKPSKRQLSVFNPFDINTWFGR
ncbi:lipase member H-like [Aricia agestis]|uniref:lipase member H-like n=1 Tax=Aricia agestis TaxID=91739 RepID=UPI001C20C2FB|nr:lipase member H-like [Aricia agestis]